MSELEVFDASIHRAVAPGSCVMIEESEIVYAGPLKEAPNATGRMVLLNARDFEQFAQLLDRRRH